MQYSHITAMYNRTIVSSMATSAKMPTTAVKNLLVTQTQGQSADISALSIYLNIVSNNLSLTYNEISNRVQVAFSSGEYAFILWYDVTSRRYLNVH